MKSTTSAPFVALVALVALECALCAQAQSAVARPVQGAPIHFTYHWATGRLTYTQGPPASGPDVPQVSYANDTYSGLMALGLGMGNELIDWGVKSGGLGGSVSSFEVGYGAFVLDTSVGGPGAQFTLTLYSGMQGWCNFNDPGTAVGTFPFSGLPASPDGNPYAFWMTVDLTGSPVQLPDGPIGLGYANSPGGMGPMMVPIGCCNTGTQDYVDEYTFPAVSSSCLATWQYQPFGNTSWHLVINEDPAGSAAKATINNGSGVNPLDFQPLNAPVIGTTWQAQITPTPTTALTVIAYSASPSQPAPFPFGPGELLVPLTPPPFLDISQTGNHSLAVPASTSWVGVALYSQGLRINVVPGLLAIEALNGIDLLIGN